MVCRRKSYKFIVITSKQELRKKRPGLTFLAPAISEVSVRIAGSIVATYSTAQLVRYTECSKSLEASTIVWHWWKNPRYV